jgi:hypothetical protein
MNTWRDNMKKSSTLLGTLFIIIGAIFLCARYLFGTSLINLGSDDFWPMIVLMIGVMFELVYFVTMKAPGFLVPGGILTTCGALFFFECATDWRFSEYTWPVYIIAVAIGLFQLYLFSGRPKGLLIAAAILTGLAVTALVVIMFEIFLSSVDISLVIPGILILVGLLLVLGRGRFKSGSY